MRFNLLNLNRSRKNCMTKPLASQQILFPPERHAHKHSAIVTNVIPFLFLHYADGALLAPILAANLPMDFSFNFNTGLLVGGSIGEGGTLTLLFFLFLVAVVGAAEDGAGEADVVMRGFVKGACDVFCFFAPVGFGRGGGDIALPCFNEINGVDDLLAPWPLTCTLVLLLGCNA